ncbi:uncharacterized protein ACNLHF_023077 isoform 1-T1 [Anomaloglossus baeobatrachus]|uniref:uncharacterized protein LOC142244646 isoform X1 n=1 Tax=Anomaloglossus baeobatrachus TaxID=238106 RepID=UPI003F508A67
MELCLQLSLILQVAAMMYSAPRISPPHQRPTAAPHSSPPQQRPVDEALDVYNKELGSAGFLFGILQDKSRDSENITFIIKETVCSKSARKEQSCPFKTDGVVKICTASLPGQEGRRLDVSCHNMDASVEALQSGENKSSSKAHHILKLLKSGKKKVETNFRQFDKQSVVGSHAVSSCVACIFEMLNQNRNINVSGQ